jgi:hypothetical protein
MSLDLTARLTLSSCVSQLTNFYDTDISPLLLEEGFQEIDITLCDLSGEVYPFKIKLLPRLDTQTRALKSLIACVRLVEDEIGLDCEPETIFMSDVTKKGMRIREVYQCAMHVCGDYIKFYTRGK